MVDYTKPIVLQGLTFEPHKQAPKYTWGEWVYGLTPRGVPKYTLTHYFPLSASMESSQWRVYTSGEVDFQGFGATAEEAWDNLVEGYREWASTYCELVDFAAPLSVEAQT